MNAIEIRNLSKSFRGMYAVEHLNMTVPVGSIYGFIGENGSGKSTTMKLLCGHLVADEGKIKLFDREHIDPGVRLRVGALIENAGCFPGSSVYQNLKMQCINLGIENAEEEIHRVLEIVRMEDNANLKFKSCSLGMKQRIGIAINMMFMAVAVFICLFISDDFRSGYAKNLFTVRAKKGEYIISKTLAGFVCGAIMLMLYLIGSMLGGAIAGLSFDLHGLNAGNLVMCMLAKVFLMLVFVSIFVLISVASKQKAWLSICGSLGGGMLLFMMVSMITPLSSTIINVVLCFTGGVLFAVGLGCASQAVLMKSSLV